MLGAIVKKCYVMYEPRAFFEVMLSPFILMPLLEFTFEGGESTKQGCDFMRLLLFNLFICEPQDAVIDNFETDFGFSIVQVADIEVKSPNLLAMPKEEEKQYKRKRSQQAMSSNKLDMGQYDLSREKKVEKIGFFQEDVDKMELITENPNEFKKLRRMQQ